MKLSKYNSKRDFSVTNEPVGKKRSPRKRLIFSVQFHEARRDHYDLRLEYDGVLLSWAVPKGPSETEKRLAVHVEDHPIDYADFEGEIPKGQYGAGKVTLWDKGTYTQNVDFAQGLKGGSLKFTLHGKRLQGDWALVRMDDKNWLLIKEKDKIRSQSTDPKGKGKEAATSGKGAESAENSNSAEKGKAESGQPNSISATKGKAEPKTNSATKGKVAKKARLPFEKFEFKRAKATESLPLGDYLYEVKYDGFRMAAFVSEKVTLRSRNHVDMTSNFAPVADELPRLDRSAILDGEMVVIKDGKPNFGLISRLSSCDEACFIAFDLLALDGKDLRPLPLAQRKTLLRKLLGEGLHKVVYGETFDDGEALLSSVKELGLEGVVCKRKDEPYLIGEWLKIKCRHRQEFVVCGYVTKNRAVSSLVLGMYHEGKLVYVGNVGSGISEKNAASLLKEFGEFVVPNSQNVQAESAPDSQNVGGRVSFSASTDSKNVSSGSTAAGKAHAQSDPALPTAEFIKSAGLKNQNVIWLRPALMAEVEFAEWTSSGKLRQPVFKGLRRDKDVKSVVNEDPSAIFGVTITHPQKQVYDVPALTKLDIAKYYEWAAPLMVPYLVGRPITVIRCNAGIDSGFFKKHPSGDKTALIYLNTPHDIMAEVQQGTVEFHVLCAASPLSFLVFDLDPSEDVPIDGVRRGVTDIAAELKKLNLRSFIKLSGGKGYHLVSPIDSSSVHELAEFSKSIAKLLELKYPGLYTSNISKDKRRGKIFIDWQRNTNSATVVAPFSLRARKGAAVSLPITKSQLGELSPSDANIFNAQSLYKNSSWKDFFI